VLQAAELHLEWLLPLFLGGLISSWCHLLREWSQGPRCLQLFSHERENVVKQSKQACCTAGGETTTTTQAPYPTMDLAAFWWWIKVGMLMGFVLACDLVSVLLIAMRHALGSNALLLATPVPAMQVSVDSGKLSLANHSQSGKEVAKLKSQLDFEKRETAQAQIEFVRRRQLMLPVQE